MRGLGWKIGVALVVLLVLSAILWRGEPERSQDGPIVLAASSLQPALTDISSLWVKQGHEPPVFSFAASSALARQIEAGASADLFLSADQDWMDYIEQRGKIGAGTRADVIANRLVMIAPADAARALDLADSASIARQLGAGGRLAIADPDVVPAGKYAKAALQSLTLWDGVSGRLAPAENVRAVLAMVERKQVPLGIVYASDPHDSGKVSVVAEFPEESHAPIRYPLARLASSHNRQAEAFRQFLLSDTARAVFIRHGFGAL